MSDNYDAKITIKTTVDNSELTPGTKEMENAVKSFKESIISTGKEINSAIGNFNNMSAAVSKASNTAKRSLEEMKAAARARNAGKSQLAQISDDSKRAEEATRAANSQLKEMNKLSAQSKPVDTSNLEDAARAQGEFAEAAHETENALRAEYEALIRAQKAATQADYDAAFGIDDGEMSSDVENINNVANAYEQTKTVIVEATQESGTAIEGFGETSNEALHTGIASLEEAMKIIEEAKRQYYELNSASGESVSKAQADFAAISALSDKASMQQHENASKFSSEFSDSVLKNPEEFAQALFFDQSEVVDQEEELLSISEAVQVCIAEIETEYEKQLASIGKIEAAMRAEKEEAAEVADAVKNATEEQEPTDGYNHITSREDYEKQIALIEQCDAALTKLQDKQQEYDAIGVDKESERYKRLQYQINQATAALNEANDEKARMEAGGVEPAEKKEDETQTRLSFMSKYMDEYMGKWQKMATLSGMVGGKMAAAFTPVLHPIQAVDRALGFLVQKAGQVAVSLARMAGHAALSFLRNLASTAVNAAIQLAKLAGNAVMSGLRRLATAAKNAAVSIAKLGGAAVKKALSGLALIAQKGVKGLTGLNKGARSSGQSFGTSLKNVLKYAFGIRSLFFLFRRLRNAVSEGLGEIAKKNPQLKAALDSLKKSLNGLKGSLASAFAPIITAVAPALTRLINLLTTAINTIGAFFAALTGQKVYTKSIGAVGDSAEKSSGKVKELEKQLASFDDLDILKANNGGGSGSGSSGDGFSYENVPIDSAIGDFVDKLKELFAAGKYEEIGRIIADGLNKAIQKVQDWIKWDNVGAIITKYMNALTSAINGLVDGFDWENLGATIGEGLNTITNTLLLWYRGIDWENLGKKFAEGVNGLIDRVDWDNLGRLISARIGSVISILKGAVTTIKWGNAGTKFASALNGFFEDENLWKDAGTTIDTAINGLLDFTGKFIVTFDAYTAGQRISEAFSQIDLDGIADRFWVNVKLAFQKAGNFLDALLGGTAGGKLVDNFKVKKSVWDDIAEKLSSGFNTAVSKLSDFISGIPITNTVSAISDWFLKVINGISFEGLGTLIGIGIRQAFNFAGTILEKFAQNGMSLGKDIATALNSALREIDWTSDKSTSVKMIITNGFKGAIALVKGFFDTLDVKELAKNLRETLAGVDWAGIARDVWDLLSDALAKIGDFLTVLFGGSVDDGFFRSITNMYNKIGKQNEYGKEDKESSGFGFEENIAQAINTVGSTILDGLTKAIESVDWGAVGSSLHTILEGIDWTDLANKVWELFSEILTSIYDLVGGLLLGDQWQQAKAAKEESRENTMEAFERTYAQDAQSALRAWSMAYGLNLEGLDHDEAKRRIQIMNNAELEGKNPTTELVRQLKNEGKNVVEIERELGLNTRQLSDTLYEVFGEENYNKPEYQQAKFIADHNDAYNAAVASYRNGNPITALELMNEYGFDNITDAAKVLQEAKEAVLGNTAASNNNTDALNNNNVVHLDVASHFGLSDADFEQYGQKIQSAINEALASTDGKFNIEALIDIGVPEDAAYEASKAFLNQWNESHVSAPISLEVGNFDVLSNMFNSETAYKMLVEAGQNMSNFVIEGLNSGEIALEKKGDELVLAFADGTKVSLGSNKDGITGLFRALGIDMSAEAIDGMSDEMKNSLVQLAIIFGIPEEEARKALNAGTFNQAGSDAASNVVDGVDDEMSASRASLKKAFGQVEMRGKEALAQAGSSLYDDSKGAGEDVLMGLKNGLGAKPILSQIKSKIEGNIDDNVIEAAKKLLEIGSPSKVFEEIGKNVWEGFKNGISAGDSSVKGAVNGLLAGVTGSSNGSAIEATVNIKKGWNGTVQDELGLNNLSTDVTVDTNTAWKANKVLDYIGLVGLKSIVGVDTKTQWSKSGALSYVGLAGLKSIVSMDTKQPWTRSVQGTLQYLGMHGLSSIISMNTNQPWSRSIQGALQYLGMNGLSSIVSINTNQPWTRSAQGSLQYLGLTNLSTTAKVTASIPWASGGGFFSSIAKSALKYFGLYDLTSTVSVDVSAPWLSSRRSPLQWLQMDYMKAYVDVDMWTPWWAAHRSPIQWLQMDNLRTVVTVDARLGNVGSVGGFLRRAKGGVFNNGHWSDIPQYAGGGIVGAAHSWYDSVAKYAKGSSGVHGSLFVAGEAGPEIVGHVGGRTEVLNKSQLASTMYSAVANGMLAAISKIDFKMPVMATGSVMPYDIAAQIAKSSADIQNTLDANNEELIQTIINLAGQIVSAVNGVQDATRRNNNAGLSAQQVINEINRRTQMYSESPLRGV